MSVVTLLNVNVRNNPAAFTDSYEFEITFECLEPLAKDLEWKLTYVGSATSSEYDQELDSLLVGPVPVGTNKFLFQANAPSLDRIPPSEILGVTVILLSCAYDDREFVRVGYYVNNEYADEALNAEPPAKPVIEKVRRNILAEKPRVTRFGIKWDSEESAPAEYPPEQPEADVAEDDEGAYGAEEAEEAEEVAAEENGEASNGAKAVGEDAEMGGADETAGTAIVVKEGEEEEEGDDGNESEDIEGESEEEEEDEEDGEEGDEMEMGEGEEKHADGANGGQQQPMKEQPDVVMAH